MGEHDTIPYAKASSGAHTAFPASNWWQRGVPPVAPLTGAPRTDAPSVQDPPASSVAAPSPGDSARLRAPGDDASEHDGLKEPPQHGKTSAAHQPTEADEQTSTVDGTPVPAGAERRRRVRGILLTTVSILALVGAAGILLNIAFYKQAVATDAASLREQLTRRVAAAQHGPACVAPPPSAATPAATPRMLIDIPAIGLSAPVLDGTDDHVLDLGVGHVSTSNWPDQSGTDVLAAHNATFFVRLPDLKPGDAITLTAPCRKWTYRVAAQQVVTNTTAVPRTVAPTLGLVTCWPIDALFGTSQRYLLTADLISAESTDSTAAATAQPAPTWKATLPAGLAGTDLSNEATGVITGRLTTAGTPSAAWQSSAASLNAVGAAVELFGGAIRTGRTGHTGWWSTLAPVLPNSALTPMLNAPGKISFKSPLDLTVTADGDALSQVDMTTTAQVGPGTYRIDATATPNGKWLSLSAWKMTLTAGTAPTPTPSAIPSNTPSPQSSSSSPAKPSADTPARPSSAPIATPTPSPGTSSPPRAAAAPPTPSTAPRPFTTQKAPAGSTPNQALSAGAETTAK